MKTDAFQRLATVAQEQSISGEFPMWLMPDVMTIVHDPERYQGKTELIEKLVQQIRDYDPYAGVGCFATSTSAAMIEATLRQILS